MAGPFSSGDDAAMNQARTVAVTGASGFVGRALVASLEADGHRVLRLVRREPQSPDEVAWDPRSGVVDSVRLQGVDAAVHLAGANLGGRPWTASYKREILESRRLGTRTIAAALAGLDRPPRVLVSASGINAYGDTGDAVVDESAPRGTGFLADVVREWEEATAPAQTAGIRVVHARSGVVAGRGGAFARLLPAVRLGVGGPLGSGRQWWSLISLRDEVRALRFVLDDDRAAGPVNLVATAARNADLVRALGRALSRPTLLRVPQVVLTTVLREMATVVLESARAEPAVLRRLGFTFTDPDLEAIARYVTRS